MPNPTVPAAASGLPESTRRHVIAGLAAAPVLAAAVQPSMAASGEPSSSLTLFTEVRAGLRAVADKIDALHIEHERLRVVCKRLYGPGPDAPRLTLADQYYGRVPRILYRSRQRRLRYAKRCERIDREQGLEAVRQARTAAREEQLQLEDAMWKQPATDIPTLVMKARIVTDGNQLSFAVVQDVLRLFGGEANV